MDTRDDMIRSYRNDLQKAYERVAALEAELAKHEWHEIDPEDEATWPEDGKLVTLKYKSGRYAYICWNKSLVEGEKTEMYVTHYRYLLGPGGGG